MERAGEDRASRFDLLAAESARARRDRELKSIGCPARPAESLSREMPADPEARAAAAAAPPAGKLRRTGEARR
jgi:hypothetical protein